VIDTARGVLITPSVVTPPPELPVRVTAPPELISTNFDTVALMLTVPVVDCPKQVTAESTMQVVSNTNLIICWGIFGSLNEVRHGHRPSAKNKLTAGAIKVRKAVKNYSATTVN
jgi:hypothetical protein